MSLADFLFYPQLLFGSRHGRLSPVLMRRFFVPAGTKVIQRQSSDEVLAFGRFMSK